MESWVQGWSINHSISIQDISSVLILALTAYIAFVAQRFSRASTYLAVTSQSLSIVNDFDRGVIESEENAQAMALLREPPPGLSIRQEYLLFIYLNHIEYTYRAWLEGLVDKPTLDGFAHDGLTYFKGRRCALVHMLESYADHFAVFLLGIFDQNASVAAENPASPN